MSQPVKGRAHTEEQKRAIVERLLVAWLRKPNQRLGQLLENARIGMFNVHDDLFYIEDTDLADAVESFTEDGR